jgi:hypothetical protein
MTFGWKPLKVFCSKDPNDPTNLQSLLSGGTGAIGPMENIDYKLHNANTFICIWQAEKPYEFVLTDNGFNIFEGNCGRGFSGFAYYYFYPVTPRRIIVASNISFKSNYDFLVCVTAGAVSEILGVDASDSWFPQELHIPPKVKYYCKSEGASLLQDGKVQFVVHSADPCQEYGRLLDFEMMTDKEKSDLAKSRRGRMICEARK